MCSNKSMCCEGLVKEIFDSIGSCGECKHYKETSQTVGGNNLLCVLNQKFKPKSHFCTDFERKGDK